MKSDSISVYPSELKNSPQFFLVIPTRNRSNTLAACIQSILSQEYQNFQLLILDNASSDDTISIAEYFASRDKRVMVSRSENPLTMVDNWERAISFLPQGNAYITFLGDDDALLPGALMCAARIAKAHQPSVISWSKAEYCWNDVAIVSMRNYLSFNISNAIRICSSKCFLREMHSFACGYATGPSIYTSFVHVYLLRQILKADGERFFRSCSPDVYSSLVIAAYCDSFLQCAYPLSINGASGASNGIAQTNDIPNKEAIAFREKNSFHPLIRDQNSNLQPVSVGIAEADSLATARNSHEYMFSAYQLSKKGLAKRIAKEANLLPSNSQRRDRMLLLCERLNPSLKYAKNEVSYASQLGLHEKDNAFVCGACKRDDLINITVNLSGYEESGISSACSYISAVLDLSMLEYEIIPSNYKHISRPSSLSKLFAKVKKLIRICAA